MHRFDLVIANGLVVDGSAAEPRVADVGIKDGMIAAVGAGVGSVASRVVDATNRLVRPGFVDVHTRCDGQATWDTHLQPSSNLGTTSAVMGNCTVGFSTSRTLIHKTSDGTQIPSYKASTEELKRLGEMLSGEQGHVFQGISDWEDAENEFDVLRQTSARTCTC